MENNNKNKKDYIQVKVVRHRKLGTTRDIQAWREAKKKEKVSPEKMPDEYLGTKCDYVDYEIPNIEIRKKVRTEFIFARKDFLKFIAKNNAKELLKEGFSRKNINSMKKGMCPKGYNVHHILPIHGGGSNDFSNLCIVKAKPVHEKIHNEYINPQIRSMQDGEKRKIKVPKPTGVVIYTPENMKNVTIVKAVKQTLMNNAKNR